MNEQQRAAMQMALEALEKATMVYEANDTHPLTWKAITALREALAQPQGEWVDLTEDELLEVMCEMAASNVVNDSVFAKAIIAKFKEKNTPLTAAQAARHMRDAAAKACEEVVMDSKHPQGFHMRHRSWFELSKVIKELPITEWIDLTDDEILECAPINGATVESVAIAVAAKLKEKNTPKVVPQGEPVAWVAEGKCRVGFGREEVRKFVVFDQTLPVGTEFYTTPLSVEAAVLAERERCEKLVDDTPFTNWFKGDLKAAIRGEK